MEKTYYPARDTYLAEVDYAHGAEIEIAAGGIPGGFIRSLVGFIVDWNILVTPIDKAIFRMFYDRWEVDELNPVGQAFAVNTLITPFDESLADYIVASQGVDWAVPGCGGAGTDYDASNTAIAYVPSTLASWMVWDVTEQVRLLQTANRARVDFRIAAVNEVPPANGYYLPIWFSSEGPPVYTPQLILTYGTQATIPWSWIIGGGVALGAVIAVVQSRKR